MHGFTDIILTPHYMTDCYETPGPEVNFWKESLQKILDDRQTGVTLHSGMEIYMTEEIGELVKTGRIIGLANSRYILVEFPMNTIPQYADSVLFLLSSIGFKVIIAHPERYKFVQDDIGYAQKLVDRGYLLQSNYGSIYGVYGTEAKKAEKKLLKMNLISFLGTDTHRPETIYKEMPDIIKKLRKVISEQELYELTTANPQKILNNEEIDS